VQFHVVEVRSSAGVVEVSVRHVGYSTPELVLRKRKELRHHEGFAGGFAIRPTDDKDCPARIFARATRRSTGSTCGTAGLR
jgi:hypothetical protein